MVGDHIRFVCGRDDALTRVKRVLVRYASFEEMLDVEGAANVNPESTRHDEWPAHRAGHRQLRSTHPSWPCGALGGGFVIALVGDMTVPFSRTWSAPSHTMLT
jgi:hypothetical protein